MQGRVYTLRRSRPVTIRRYPAHQESTAVGQAAACAPATQRALVRSPVGTSFLGEVFFGVLGSAVFVRVGVCCFRNIVFQGLDHMDKTFLCFEISIWGTVFLPIINFSLL